MTVKTNILAACFIAGTLLVSCKGGEEEKVDAEITKDTLSAEVSGDMRLIRATIPSPTELANEIALAKFNYNKGLMSSSSKAGSFSTNFQKAAGMGAFGANMAYASAYNQAQDMIEYFGSISKLSKDLGIESVFDESMMARAKDNMGKKDSMSTLIDRAYDKAERNLRSHQRVGVAAVIAAGGWIEGIFISSSLIKDVAPDEKNKPVYDRTWKHVSSFSYVIDLLNQYKSNADCAKMLEALKDFQPLVDKTNSSGGGVMTQADVQAINQKIGEIRSKILG